MRIATADTGTTVHAGLAHRCATGAGNRSAVVFAGYSRCEDASGCAGTVLKRRVALLISPIR